MPLHTTFTETAICGYSGVHVHWGIVHLIGRVEWFRKHHYKQDADKNAYIYNDSDGSSNGWL
jgi:hypothetical protein